MTGLHNVDIQEVANDCQFFHQVANNKVWRSSGVSANGQVLATKSRGF